MNLHFTGKYIKKEGVLKFSTTASAKQYEVFTSHIQDGQLVECFYEVTHDDGTLPLATHIGETVENLKLLVKDRAGLCIAREVAGKEYFLAKSFGDCSKEELSLAIQAVIEIGEDVNYLLG